MEKYRNLYHNVYLKNLEYFPLPNFSDANTKILDGGCLIPTLFIDKSNLDFTNTNQTNIQLLPGYKSITNEFYQCPIPIKHIQLNVIEYLAKYKSKVSTINTNLIICDIQNNKYRKIEVSLSSSTADYDKFPISAHSFNLPSRKSISLHDIFLIIQDLNRYIDYGNDIIDIDKQNFIGKYELELLSNQEMINAINRLKFKFYQNGHSRVGKDDSFWNEVEIKDVPQNDYIIKNFIEWLKGASFVDNISIKQDDRSSHKYLHLIIDSHRAWSGADKFKEIDIDEHRVQDIKDCLKISLTKEFDFIKEFNERLKTKLKIS